MAGISAAQSVAPVLARLDQTARSFTGVTAKLTSVTHTAVIEKDESDIGMIVVRRSSSGKLQVLLTFQGQSKNDLGRSIALRDGKAEIYYPKLNVIHVYDLDKYRDAAEKFLLLGLGTSGRELAANYGIRNLGAEKVDSQATTHLELIPKLPDVSEHLTKVDLWISEKLGVPIQQKFYMRNGDYRLATYTDMNINPDLASSALDLPKGAKRERMN